MGKHKKKKTTNTETPDDVNVIKPDGGDVILQDQIDDGYEYSGFYTQVKETGALDWVYRLFPADVVRQASRIADTRMERYTGLIEMFREASTHPDFQKELHSYLMGKQTQNAPDKERGDDG